jgi:hypothetical protein
MPNKLMIVYKLLIYKYQKSVKTCGRVDNSVNKKWAEEDNFASLGN